MSTCSCTSPIYLQDKNMSVPCGKCLGCRMKRSSEWTMRMIHELESYDNNAMWLTLTYQDEYMDLMATLVKSDLQNFFKSVRQCISPRTIRYYGCGEYGSRHTEDYYIRRYGRKFGRPHYHIILFGMNYQNRNDRKVICKYWKKCIWDANRIRSCIGYVSADSMRYTADYVKKKYIVSKPKKIDGESEKQFNDRLVMYMIRQREYYGYCIPPYQFQSQGIGKDYLLENKDYLHREGKVLWRGKLMSLPRYYTKKLDVPISVKSKNKVEALGKIRKKYKINVLDDLDIGITTKILNENHKQDLCQTASNRNKRKEIADSRKKVYN